MPCKPQYTLYYTSCYPQNIFQELNPKTKTTTGPKFREPTLTGTMWRQLERRSRLDSFPLLLEQDWFSISSSADQGMNPWASFESGCGLDEGRVDRTMYQLRHYRTNRTVDCQKTIPKLDEHWKVATQNTSNEEHSAWDSPVRRTNWVEGEKKNSKPPTKALAGWVAAHWPPRAISSFVLISRGYRKSLNKLVSGLQWSHRETRAWLSVSQQWLSRCQPSERILEQQCISLVNALKGSLKSCKVVIKSRGPYSKNQKTCAHRKTDLTKLPSVIRSKWPNMQAFQFGSY